MLNEYREVVLTITMFIDVANLYNVHCDPQNLSNTVDSVEFRTRKLIQWQILFYIVKEKWGTRLIL